MTALNLAEVDSEIDYISDRDNLGTTVVLQPVLSPQSCLKSGPGSSLRAVVNVFCWPPFCLRM